MSSFIRYGPYDHADQCLLTFLEKNLEITTQEAEQETSIARHYANKLEHLHRRSFPLAGEYWASAPLPASYIVIRFIGVYSGLIDLDGAVPMHGAGTLNDCWWIFLA